MELEKTLLRKVGEAVTRFKMIRDGDRVAVAVSGGKLYAAWKTGDPTLLKNAGDVPNALFKSGGALDLMIGTDAAAKPDRPSAARYQGNLWSDDKE